MKHLQTKSLSTKRRIAAHFLTTSTIAILGVQIAGAITVTNPTITGYGTATRCEINTSAPAGFQTADSSNGGGADQVDVRVVSNGVNVGQDSRFVFKFGSQNASHFTKITNKPAISNGPLTLEWIDTPGTNVVASLNIPLADLHAAGGECATAAIQAGFVPVGTNTAPIAAAGPDQNLLADFTGSGTAQTVIVDAASSSDPDGDTLTYSWTQVSGPATARISSAEAPNVENFVKVSVNPARAVFSQPSSTGTVVYRVTVTDPSGETDTDDISVVWSANTPPTTTAPNTQNPNSPVLAGSSVPLSSGTSISTSGNPVTYSWVQTSGPSVTLDNPNSPNPNFPAPAAGGIVTFVLTISDGISTTTQTVTVNLVIDQTPVADAGPDQTLIDVARGTVVTLDGTSSIDPDGGTLTYAWSQVSGASVTLSDATAAQPTFTYPHNPHPKVSKFNSGKVLKGQPANAIVFELIVSDGASTSAADQVTITINTNDVPVADAGVDQTLFGQANGDTFTLAGSGTDPDGDTLTFTWTQTAGRSLTLSDATLATPTVTYDGGGTTGVDDVFTFSLIVNDGSTDSVADTVTFTLKDNRVPIANAGIDQNGINAGEIVTLNGSGSSDADGDALTYTWSQVSGPTAALSSTTVENPTFTAPDVTGASTLVYQLIVSDGKVSSVADTVSIGVQPTGTITIIQIVQGSDNSFAFDSPIAALNTSLQTSGGTGQLFADDVNTGTYTVTAADMKSQGYALTNLTCNDGDSTADLNERKATIVLAPGENVTCTFTSVNSREAATVAIQEYLTVRNALILSHQPSRSRRIDRLKGQSANGSVTAGGLALPGSTRLPVQVAMNGDDASFATSLSSARAAGGALKTGKGSIDVWGEAYLSNFDAAGRDGNFSIYYAGADYLMSDKVLVGGLVQLDKFKQSGANGVGGVGAGNGDGYMVGPYVTARLSDNIYVDARAAWGKSDNSISPLGTFVDDFNTKRMLYSGSVTGEFKFGGKVLFEPAISLRHLGEVQEAYTDTLGVIIPEQDVSQGELSFAPRIATSLAMKNGWTMRPHASLEGIYSFGDYVENILGSNTRARVEGGVDWYSQSGVTAGISAFADGLGADSYGAQGIRVSLSYTMK